MEKKEKREENMNEEVIAEGGRTTVGTLVAGLQVHLHQLCSEPACELGLPRTETRVQQ